MTTRSGAGTVAAVDRGEIVRQVRRGLALARRDALAVEARADDELDRARERRVLLELRARHRRLQRLSLRLPALRVLDDRLLSLVRRAVHPDDLVAETGEVVGRRARDATGRVAAVEHLQLDRLRVDRALLLQRQGSRLRQLLPAALRAGPRVVLADRAEERVGVVDAQVLVAVVVGLAAGRHGDERALARRDALQRLAERDHLVDADVVAERDRKSVV